MKSRDQQQPPSKPAFPSGQVDDSDLNLIHEMLNLSYDERLQQLEDHAAMAQELRDANPTLRVQKNT